jgi:hypothetical protein
MLVMLNKREDIDWDLLLGRIKDGKCTPFLGAGACVGKIPSGSQIAFEWAKKYGYPMEDSYDLIRVAQFVAVIKDPTTPKELMCKKINEIIKEVPPSYFENPDEPHGVLADLPLSVYITTNYDDFMERSLKSRGKAPIQEYCRWNKNIKKRKRMYPDFDPTPEKPLVFHLHGIYEVPESLVLTEDDYLDFLVAISRDLNMLPPRIQEAFADTSLLFLGYRIADWDFRVFFRILAEYLESNKKRHYSVQLVPGNVSETQKKEAKKYLDNYFEKLDIHVYWHECRDFAVELKSQWEAFICDTNKKDIDRMDIIARDFEPVKTIHSMANIDQYKTGYERTGQIKEEMKKVSILFLAADPTDASRLRLGEELREIQEKLKLAMHRDHFKLEAPQLSVRPSDITQALLDTQPYIVHFSGHGTFTGALCFENPEGETHPIEPDALAALFEQFSSQVNCVVLNACYSEIQAKAISEHIKYVIGMNQAIGDKAAIAFAIGFYQALGGGRSIEGAYELGCIQIQLQNIPEHLTPVLIKNRAQLSLPNKIKAL